MAHSPSILLTVFAFILLLGPLIVLHELGHYWAGRLFGVRAETFSIGFGKELWHRIDKRGTRWRVAAFPMGGYVMFAGDADPSSKPAASVPGVAPAAGTLAAAKLWQRVIIILAGPFANLLTAIVILAAFSFAYGKPVNDPVVVDFAEHSDAQAAGVAVGDRILAINGISVTTVQDAEMGAALRPGQTIDLEVTREGRNLLLPVKLTSHDFRDEFGNESQVGTLGIDFAPPVVMDIAKGSGAEAAGLKPGDRILTVAGEKVDGFVDIRKIVETKPGQSVPLEVERDGKPMQFTVKLGSIDSLDQSGAHKRIGLLGISAGKVEPVGPIEAIGIGTSQSLGMVRMMVIGLKQIVVGERSIRELHGLPKIAKFSGEMLSLGWLDFISFAALISINLAFINLLPIPTLDGGHLAIYAAEAIRRRPLGLRSQELAFRIGMAFVLAFALFVTVNDLAGMFL